MDVDSVSNVEENWRGTRNVDELRLSQVFQVCHARQPRAGKGGGEKGAGKANDTKAACVGIKGGHPWRYSAHCWRCGCVGHVAAHCHLLWSVEVVGEEVQSEPDQEKILEVFGEWETLWRTNANVQNGV